MNEKDVNIKIMNCFLCKYIEYDGYNNSSCHIFMNSQKKTYCLNQFHKYLTFKFKLSNSIPALFLPVTDWQVETLWLRTVWECQGRALWWRLGDQHHSVGWSSHRNSHPLLAPDKKTSDCPLWTEIEHPSTLCQWYFSWKGNNFVN